MLLEGCLEGSSDQRVLGPGPFRVGSGADDDWRVEGLPPQALRFEVDGDLITVQSSTEVQVGGEPLLPGRPRLLLPKERISWSSRSWLELRFPKDKDPQLTRTAHLVRGLLRGEEILQQIRMPSLLFLTGLDLGKVLLLANESDDATWTLGRGDDDAGIRLRDRSVSRRHARLFRRDGQLWIEDLGSPNGILRNGQRLSKPEALQDGDLLRLGYALLKYRIPSPPQISSRQAPTGEDAALSLTAGVAPQGSLWDVIPSDGWLAAFLLLAATVGLYCCFGL